MFLTLEDPNAKLKGSRDPLGTQPIWATFGRRVVSNLTTQTNSVRGFTILLLGRYFGARLIDEERLPREAALDVVLRMEQIGAYVRHVAHEVEGDIRGIERVRTFLEEKKRRVDIQSDRRGYILRDQKVTGLWGLYSVAARNSGLLSAGPIGVEPPAREFIKSEYLPILKPAINEFIRLLQHGGKLDVRLTNPVFSALANVLQEKFTPAETQFYGEYLRDGLHTGILPAGIQKRFRELLLANTDLNGPFGRKEVLALTEAARQVDTGLAQRLKRIGMLEAVLAPAASLFDFILTQHGQRIEEVASILVERWKCQVPNIHPPDFRELIPEVGEASTEAISIAVDKSQRALASGHYVNAIHALLDWNAEVMRERKAGPWVIATPSGRLDVRYRGAEQFLPDADALQTLWRNTYFIDSLKRVTRQLENRA